MSTRYYNRWVKAFAANGGHPGAATLKTLAPQAAKLAGMGVSTTAAGLICANAYKAHRQLTDCQEEAAYLKVTLHAAGVSFIGAGAR